MTTLNLHGERGRRITIAVHGYERDAAQSVHDANWLRCSVEVEHGAFRGAVSASLTTHDFSRFLAELSQVVTLASAVASFDTMEETLAFRVEVDRAGRAIASGKLRDGEANGAELTFRIECDIPALTSACSDLKRIVAEFPERSASA
jgi:hypothetical protein